MKIIIFLTFLTMTALSAELVPVFQDDMHQFTGVAISKVGRMFINYPRWQSAHQYDVIEVSSNNIIRPYPNGRWNDWEEHEIATNKWVCVQAVYVDDNDQLWTVDPAAPEMKKVKGHGAKLVSIDLRSDRVTRVYNLSKLVGKSSYLNDVRVDTRNQTAYLTESKNGGIVVLDIPSGKARLLLRNHYSVKTDPHHKLTVDGVQLMRDGKPFKGNSDGIALSPDGQWLYYKALSDTKLFRIPTEALRDTKLSKRELESKVEDLGAHFTTSDGMIFDKKGRLYLSDSEHNAIVQITPDLKWKTIVQDSRLIWPDTFSWGPDGWLYVTCSQIQKMPWCHEGISFRATPYTVYKLKVE